MVRVINKKAGNEIIFKKVWIFLAAVLVTYDLYRMFQRDRDERPLSGKVPFLFLIK